MVEKIINGYQELEVLTDPNDGRRYLLESDVRGFLSGVIGRDISSGCFDNYRHGLVHSMVDGAYVYVFKVSSCGKGDLGVLVFVDDTGCEDVNAFIDLNVAPFLKSSQFSDGNFSVEPCFNYSGKDAWPGKDCKVLNVIVATADHPYGVIYSLLGKKVRLEVVEVILECCDNVNDVMNCIGVMGISTNPHKRT